MDQGTASTVLAEERRPPTPEEQRVRARTVRDYRHISIMLGITDFVAIVLAFTAAYVYRFGPTLGNVKFLEVGLIAPPIWIGIFFAFRLYSVQRFAPAEEFRRVIYAITIGITVIVTASYWTKADLSREWVSLAWVVSMGFVLVTRRGWHHYIWKSRRSGGLAYRTLIVGTNDEAAHLASVMRRRKVGFEAVGFVSTGNGRADLGDLPIVSDIGGLAQAIKLNQIECVYVASSALKTSDMRDVTRASRVGGVEVRVSANIPELMSSRLAAQPLGGLMAFSIWPVRLTGVQAAMKRTFDLVVSAFLIVLLSPLLIAIAMAVKASRGPVLYRQIRVGRKGREFTLLKFRTMIVGADAMLADQRSDVAAPLFKVKNDKRVTRAGRWLRRWSLDELPQLVNVFRGDMSLVGPRPPLPSEVHTYELWHRDRLAVRPGITGLWQVSGRSDLSFDDYVRLDLFYIENWSLAFDFYLLLKTGPAVVAGKGAF